MKILILKRDKIGDLLLTTPLLRHLRATRPAAQIHVLANDYNAWLLEQNKDIDRLWVYPRTRHNARVRIGAIFQQAAQLWALRRERYDAVIVAGGEESPRAIKRAALIHARYTIGYCDTPQLKRYLSHALATPQQQHEADRMLSLLAPLGIDPPAVAALPTFVPSASCHEQGAQWLATHGLGDRAFMVIGLGARRAKKQPSVDQVLAWAQYAKRHHDLETVFMWTPGKSDNRIYPGDDDAAQAVLARRPPYLHPCREALFPALGIVWRARLSIFPDSGLMHLAAASPGGVIGLFATGSQSPSQWAPRGRRAHYLEAKESVANLPSAAVYERLELLAPTTPCDRIAAG